MQLAPLDPLYSGASAEQPRVRVLSNLFFTATFYKHKPPVFFEKAGGLWFLASGKWRYGADDWFSMSANGSPSHWPVGLLSEAAFLRGRVASGQLRGLHSIVAASNPHRI